MADLKEFKQKYPDIHAAIHEEGKAEGLEEGQEIGKQAGLEVTDEKASKEGAAGERQRIMDVQAQNLGGHEELIQALMFDGVTTGPEAAVQVLAAEKSVRERALDDHRADAPAPVDDVATDNLEATDEALPLNERCQKAWDKDSKIRTEFDGDFETYLAAEKALAGGNVRVISGKSE